MRTRSEFSNHAPCIITDVYPQNGTQSQSVISLGKDYSRVTTDTVVPGFKTRSAAGEIFNNPFSSSAEWYSYQGYYYNESWNLNPDRCVHTRSWDKGWSSASADFTNPFSVPDLSGSAGNKAMAGVNSTQFNAPLFIAEAQKTRALIPQIGELLVKTFRDGRRKLRRGQLVGFYQATSKNLANAWLIGRFGVTPLLYELQGACELLSKNVPPRATARGNENWNADTTSVYNIGDSCGTWHVTKTSKIEVAFRNGILYEGGTSNLSHLARLGFTRPATVAWELVPWSFVIDRFVDISSWLDAIQYDGASRTLAAWKGSKTTLSITCDVSGFTPNAAYGKTQRNSTFTGRASKISIVKNRNPWTPEASLPTWNPHFNIKHLGDYAALVRQRIRSGA